MQRSSFSAARRIVVAVGLVFGSVVAFAARSDVGTRASHERVAAAVSVSFDPLKVTLFARTPHCKVAASAPAVRANLVCG